MDSCVNVVRKRQKLVYQRKQFYSLNKKSGKISHCVQTDGNKKKENIMCFLSQRMTTERITCLIRKKRVKWEQFKE